MVTRIFGSSYIVSSGPAVTLLDTDSVYVAAGATLGSEGNSAIVSQYGSNTIDIYGNVIGSTAAIFLGSSSQSSSHHHKVKVHAGAQVYGYGPNQPAVGIELFGYADTILNEGYVAGDQYGIRLATYAGSGGSVLTNSGRIEGGSTAVYRFSYAGASSLTLTNSGTIEGGSNAFVDKEAGATIITNTGRMIGKVSLGVGEDKIDTTSGRVQGTIDLGDGNDTAYGSSAADSILGGNGNDLIRGNAGKDTLNGGANTDVLDYREKTNGVELTLRGATASTVLVNGATEDRISNFEGVYGGSGADKLTGDTFANLLVSYSGNDTLSGDTGNDTLAGGLGKDTLTGGGGADVFRFDSAFSSSNIDTITDFNHTSDTIQLDDAIFIALAPPTNALSGAAHAAGTSWFRSVSSGHAASNTGHKIIYDRSTGELWYDGDGNTPGGSTARLIATLSNKPATIDHTDFLII